MPAASPTLDAVLQVSIPCLVLHARDDPVCAPAFCPMLAETASTNRNVIVLLTNRGGHSGWHQGAYPTGPSWAEYVECIVFVVRLIS